MLLIVSALLESGAGIALLVVPGPLARVLFGRELDSTESLLLARIAGAALLAIGLICWRARGGEIRGARTGPVPGLLLYNAAIVALFVAGAVVWKMHGIGLWPAAALHAVLLVWCIASLRKE